MRGSLFRHAIRVSGMEIQWIHLLEKSGGKSGHFVREEEPAIAVPMSAPGGNS